MSCQTPGGACTGPPGADIPHPHQHDIQTEETPVTRCAVLTNDLQYDLVNKNEERREAVAAFTPKMTAFLAEMRQLNVPIVHLQLINKEDDPRAKRYDGWLPVTKGSDGARIMGEFLAEEDVIVEKNKDSGFYETDLDERLKELGVDTVAITGMQTQI